MSIVFGFMLKHEATSFSSFSLAQLCRNNKKIGGNHRSKSKATTTTDICNTMGDCECKPCQKIFYIKTTCSQSSSYGKDISLFYA